MLTDLMGQPLRAGLDGWSDLKLIPASNAHEVRGLEELASLVAAGAMPGDVPVFYGTKEASGGLPSVRVAVPLTVEELQAWQQGDRSVTGDIVEALEAAYEDFLDDVRRNRVPARLDPVE